MFLVFPHVVFAHINHTQRRQIHHILQVDNITIKRANFRSLQPGTRASAHLHRHRSHPQTQNPPEDQENRNCENPLQEEKISKPPPFLCYQRFFPERVSSLSSGTCSAPIIRRAFVARRRRRGISIQGGRCDEMAKRSSQSSGKRRVEESFVVFCMMVDINLVFFRIRIVFFAALGAGADQTRNLSLFTSSSGKV